MRSGFAALVGWTNVGKSTLLNRLVGEKLAAVADAPQTTRTRILGARTLPGRGQVVFVDTPGLHHPRHRMNRAMVAVAREAPASVDLTLLVVDAEAGLGEGDAEAAHLVVRSAPAALGVLNKIDRVSPKEKLLPLMARLSEWGLPESFPVSALTGEGCDHLLDAILERLPEGPPPFEEDFLTDQPERALAAEWIREKLVRHTREEIPHATAVAVTAWTERPDGLVEIEATITVEKENQKAIVIGKGGSVLKRVGAEARAELETFLQARVFLRLWVRVRKGWRDDERALHDLGLS